MSREDDDLDDLDLDHLEPGQPMFDTEALLRRAIDIIATARTIPLSSSPMINRDEIIEILEEANERLPEELRQARWMLKERQAFIDKTRREADDILDAARAQAERMVQRQEVVRQADVRARQIVEAAEQDARQMRLQVEDFCDQRLGSFEIILDRLQRVVGAGRAKLASGFTAPAAPPPTDPAATAFFDQDALPD